MKLCIGYSFPDELKALYLETNGDNYFLLSLEQMIENVKLNREYFPDCFETFEEYLARVDRLISLPTDAEIIIATKLHRMLLHLQYIYGNMSYLKLTE